MAPQDILATEFGIISNMAEGNSLKSPLYFGVVPFDKKYSKKQEKFSMPPRLFYFYENLYD
jgi:hypothetical protein